MADADYTPTRITWLVDTIDGQVFKRFSRRLDVELWVMGYETVKHDSDLDRIAGSSILDRGAWRVRKMHRIGFAVPRENMETVADIASTLNAGWSWPDFDELALLCDPLDFLSAPRLHEDDLARIQQIADDVVARLRG